ncbi:MAG: VCBS repeat-containing protein [Candidatus Marinimicrobia bacterium]|nr:VCBS repeat-containing protein [Candidatus Neomarinimicrobiota bacterium]
MVLTLNQIERRYQDLSYQINNGLSERSQLSLFINFYQSLQAQPEQAVFLSYYQESYENFFSLLSESNLAYRSPSYLEAIQTIGMEISRAGIKHLREQEFENTLELVQQTRIRHLCYAGMYAEVFELLSLAIPRKLDASLAPLEQLARLVELLKKADKPQVELFELTHKDWINRIAGCSREAVWIPLVEQTFTTPEAALPEATIQPLGVEVNILDQNTSADILLFNNHPIQPGDQLYDQALDALLAAKAALRFGDKKRPGVQISFGFPQREFFYTGESFGLGMALVILAQLEQLSGQRKQHCLRNHVVYTGGLGLDGKVRGVSKQTFPAKLNAFRYSPFTVLVAPHYNTRFSSESFEDQAYILDEVVSVDDLKQVKENSAIVEHKLISWQSWFGRQLKQNNIYHRVILLILTMLSIYFIWYIFPYNVEGVKASGTRIYAVDELGLKRWEHDFGVPIDLKHLQISNTADHRTNQTLLIEDINADGKKDVILGLEQHFEHLSGSIQFLDGDGVNSWSVFPDSLVINDSIYSTFNVGGIKLADINGDGSKEIIAMINNTPWFPSVLTVLNSEGERLAWFYNAGHFIDIDVLDLYQNDTLDLLVTLYNNEYKRAGLAVFDPGNFSAVSPQSRAHYRLDFENPRGLRQYLLLKGTHFMQIPGSSVHQAPKGLDPNNNGNILVRTGDGFRDNGLYYYFDYNLNMKRVALGDNFYAEYEKLIGHSIFQDFPNHSYLDSIKQINYWNGSGWQLKPFRIN